MNFALLLSGGVGTRIESEIPKQYIKLGDYMMITYSLSTLLRSDKVDAVCIVADAAWRDEIQSDIERLLQTDKRIIYANPGENRQLSILSAMDLISGDASTVLIHDAARPFLSEEEIRDCYEALPGHDGVMPVLPMKDTVYRSGDGGRVSELLERSEIFAGQAPELFLFDKYYDATRALLPERILAINGSTEPAIIAGMDVVMIPGDEDNFKVTTEADLVKAREKPGR